MCSYWPSRSRCARRGCDRAVGALALAVAALAVAALAVAALAVAALAVIHVVDLPATLGPTPLVGPGYLGIVAAAVLTGGVMIARSHWLAPGAVPAGAVPVSAMGGYALTRAVPGASWGPWRCRQLALPAGHHGP